MLFIPGLNRTFNSISCRLSILQSDRALILLNLLNNCLLNIKNTNRYICHRILCTAVLTEFDQDKFMAANKVVEGIPSQDVHIVLYFWFFRQDQDGQRSQNYREKLHFWWKFESGCRESCVSA